MRLRGRVLVVAGSDSGGGAGVQADIKAISAMGAYAATALTALTAQNTLGVQGVLGVPAAFVTLQMRSVLDDLGADAVKTGMLADRSVIEAVAEALRTVPGVPLVLDPVMVAKGGQSLLDPAAVAALVHDLLPSAAVVTPNLPEAEALTGAPVADVAAMHRAAERLLRMGAAAVLLKGGHLPGGMLTDLLATPDRTTAFEQPRVPTRHTHGTGCTLASALAAGLAQGMDLPVAVARARAYVRAAIETAPGLGAGHGPLNHLAWADG
ncbi:MAG: bifunctional hydroxymethylpyrimidine kinase/phosphomethylpyrimidine kinase [Janthinobacterium lividum]